MKNSKLKHGHGPNNDSSFKSIAFYFTSTVNFFSLADIRADNYLRCLSTGKRQPK